MITLKKITEENFIDAFNLKLDPKQEEYVSHPIRSLAQAYVYREQCQPFGIFNDEKMVGYVMVIYDYDIPEYDIWHMMIDMDSQGKGYGSAALDKVLDYIKSKGDRESIIQVMSLKPAGYLLKSVDKNGLREALAAFFAKQMATN